MTTLWYFAYGSNMQTATFRGRRGIEFRCAVPGRATGWRLVFDKPPLFPIGESFANVVPDATAEVTGVLYEIDGSDLRHIELTEGVPLGNYRRVEIEVQPLNDPMAAPVSACTFTSEVRDRSLRPSDRYMKLVIEGAVEHALPAQHVAFLRAVPSQPESPAAALWRPLLDAVLEKMRCRHKDGTRLDCRGTDAPRPRGEGSMASMDSTRSGDLEHGPDVDRCREPTWFLNSNDPDVVAFTRRSIGNASTEVEKAVRLYYAVRDGIWYSPYAVARDRDAYRASTILHARSAFCVQKAIVLAASARAAGISSRLGYADVRNHLASEKLREMMKTDVFVFHGFTELHLQGKWIKATPTFNRELCARFGVRPLEFDGINDAIFHPFDEHNRRHMEYIRQRGTFTDFPFEEMLRGLAEAYPDMAEEHGRVALDDPAFDPQK